ncbi:MAG TPA: aldo/keto reductase [Phenylobacterium sp.]|uniref:aldo/keto reductase n=1 Tax=Phenylobacterium sp. TaxID=1871053 RepID=UPI002B460721|nr:aldo/keto reductase [Phenylobacterium sp.]HKR87854.1 aldo/keto reductase [Phenylobacterium sp.]HKT53056.1 aldo/keto reductase [Caulobacteraceae bacterium]
MQLRRLGASGLLVSELGLGCNNFGMRIGPEQACAVVDAAYEAGITLFDTADVYGENHSETYLGAALGARRKDVIVATKFGSPIDGSPYRRGASRRWIIEACEASLRRLGTDYIDLYQLHWPDPGAPLDETLRALDDLIIQGKVRYVGSSNLCGWQIADADWTARDLGLTRFVSTQNLLSLLERDAAKEVLPACERFGVGFLPYFPLASGLLTGKYRRGRAPPGDGRLANWGERGRQTLSDVNLDRVAVLTQWAEARGRSILELAFAWLLHLAPVSSVIAGATSPGQILANVHASSAWRLDAQEVADLAVVLGSLN